MGQASRGDARPVDLEVLRDATAGDRDLMQELAELYVGDTDLQLRALDDAVANREADRVRRIGHALRGASLSMGARPSAQIYEELEEAAQAADFPRIVDVIARSRVEFDRVRRTLADLR